MIVVTALAVTSASVNAQTLGAAGSYDIFVTNGGTLDLVDSNQLFGQIGVSDQAEFDAGNESQTFDGAIYLHSGSTLKDGDGLNPSGGIQSSSAIDDAIDQANIDLINYANYLGGLSSTQSFGELKDNAFTYSSTMSLSVLDFTKVDLGLGEDFTLNGSAGGMDQIIIRVSDDFKFDEANVILNDLAIDNVIWYYSGDSNFDLHKSDDANPMNFAGTVVALDGKVILGEVDFTGRVYGGELKLGSGFEFTGTVPEPSSSVMMILGATSLLMLRRRK